MNTDRMLVIKSVYEGKLGSEYLTDDELSWMMLQLAEAEMLQTFMQQAQRGDVTLFVSDLPTLH